MDPNQDQGVVEEKNIPPQPADVQQPEPTPSSDQTQPTDVPEQVAPEQDAEPENPRTAQRMQELLAENKRLKQGQLEKQYGTSVFDSFNPQVPQVPQGTPRQVDVNQFVSPDGTVDINGLNQALYQSKTQSEAAMQQAKQTNEKIARLEESQQVKEAHQVHPWLDPMNGQFDPKGYELVRDKLLSSMVFNRKTTLLDAANEVSLIYKPQAVDVTKAKEQGVAEFKKAQELRRQGPITPGNGAPRVSSDTDLSELKARTRKGDSDAIMERMKGIGLVKS